MGTIGDEVKLIIMLGVIAFIGYFGWSYHDMKRDLAIAKDKITQLETTNKQIVGVNQNLDKQLVKCEESKKITEQAETQANEDGAVVRSKIDQIAHDTATKIKQLPANNYVKGNQSYSGKSVTKPVTTDHGYSVDPVDLSAEKLQITGLWKAYCVATEDDALIQSTVCKNIGDTP